MAKKINDKLHDGKEKFVGKVEQATGKITGNQQLELKGRVKSAKVDFKKKVDVGTKVDAMKENVRLDKKAKK